MAFQISTTWGTSGTVFLSASLPSGTDVNGHDLASILFTWDAESMYGTWFETTTYRGQMGIELTATEALRLFSNETLMNHEAVLTWDLDIGAVRAAARLLQTAVQERSILPDFQAWKQGEQKWKLNPQGMQRLEEIARDAEATTAKWLLPDVGVSPVYEWLNQLIQEAALGDGEVAVGMTSTLQMHPRLQAISALQFEDEQDWLMATGFGNLDTPFSVCLELCEPSADDVDQGMTAPWKLRVLLRDQHATERIYALPNQAQADEETCPDVWLLHLEEVNRAVRIWQALCPWLGHTVTSQGGSEIVSLQTELDGNGAWTFLTEAAPVLAEAGYPILVPPWWEEIRKRHARMKARVSASSGPAKGSLFGLQQIVSFDWRVALGDLEISEAEFEAILEQKQRLIRVQGRWIEIRPEFVEQFRKTTKKYLQKRGPTFADVLELVLLGEGGADAGPSETDIDAEDSTLEDFRSVDFELDDVLGSLFYALQHAAELPVLDTPPRFVGELRPYQRVGFSWLTFLRTHGLGACLADDMGLGKTVQYTAYLLQSRRGDGFTVPPTSPAMLVCPTSVLGNWQKELARFAPDLKVYLHYGSNRRRDESFAEAVADADLVLTSYSLCHLDVDVLKQVTWDSICLDEAQNIKNPHTKQAMAIRQLPGLHRIAMTGTPVENRLTELWSIFEFMNPGYLGSLAGFQKRFQKPIERDEDVARINQLKRFIGPFLLRRTKKDPAIELDLPEKMEMKVFVPLTGEQAALYEAVVQGMMDKLDTANPMERRGLILASLTKLKQVCNHPALFLKEELGRTIMGRSAKVDRLVDMVGELRSEGDACLIFTQFVEAGRMLQQALAQELGEPALFLHGGLKKSQRDQMVAEFQSGQGTGILILSLRAGGVGLNLTAANHVLHYDRWWNPAVENQATDRAYRIGQHRRVQVHKFVTLGTLEERIDEMIQQKSAMSEQIVGAGEQWITELSTGELRELFQLRRNWSIED